MVIDVHLNDVALARLSASEREIATLCMQGQSNVQIAQQRNVSEKTVANQIFAIFEKLGVASRWELAAHLVDDSAAQK
jgi:DNA-binding NarL/FixJ family response regulator